MRRKTEIDSILLVNLYLTGCKLKNPKSPATELVRQYLGKKINNALTKRNETKFHTPLHVKALVSIITLFLIS